MKKYNCKEGWQDWLDDYKLRMDDLEKNGKNVQTVNTDELIAHDFKKIKEIINNLDLIWKEEKVKKQIKP